jgi:hypothetical protein
MIRLTLFHTSHCHLCEQAESLLVSCLDPASADVWAVDIADRDDLLERYGVRIPVLRRESDGKELDWPFDAQALASFVGGSADGY